MKKPITHPSWTQIEKGCARLALDVIKSGFEPDYIVGVSRGGLIPAVIISNIIDVSVIPVSYSSRSGKGNNKNHENILPTIYGNIESGTGSLSPAPSILLIDEIADSGNTLNELYNHYTNQGHIVRTGVLYFKQHPPKKHIFTPDFWWQKIDEDSGWVEFPWEL